MTRLIILLALIPPTYAQSLRGTVTDPSGAVIVGATVQLKGPDPRTTRPHRCRRPVRIHHSARGPLSSPHHRQRLHRRAAEGHRNRAAADSRHPTRDPRRGPGGDRAGRTPRRQRSAEANGGRVVLRERQLAALSDDPDELALQLQALAGPAPGPGGGEILHRRLQRRPSAPKASIREVRINANPFSPEYDRPGFSRIEVFTKPGSDLSTARPSRNTTTSASTRATRCSRSPPGRPTARRSTRSISPDPSCATKRHSPSTPIAATSARTPS